MYEDSPLYLFETKIDAQLACFSIGGRFLWGVNRLLIGCWAVPKIHHSITG